MKSLYWDRYICGCNKRLTWVTVSPFRSKANYIVITREGWGRYVIEIIHKPLAKKPRLVWHGTRTRIVEAKAAAITQAMLHRL